MGCEGLVPDLMAILSVSNLVRVGSHKLLLIVNILPPQGFVWQIRAVLVALFRAILLILKLPDCGYL